MKVCISLRDLAGNNLRADNLRSEPRWERLVLESCISNPEITDIYTLGYMWEGGKSITNKYKGILPETTRDCILLMQDWNNSVINCRLFKAAVINLFAGPWIEQKEEVLNTTKKLNDNLFFVVGHPNMYVELLEQCGIENVSFSEVYLPKCFNYLQNFTTLDRFFYLPLPWIPNSVFEDRFNNKNLLWAIRPLLMEFIVDSVSIKWAFKRMMKDTSLKLNILTGWKPEEVKDRVNGKVISIKEEINSYFWKFKNLEPYLSLKNRVKLHYGLEWSEVLDINAISKLLISYGRQYGGAPMEAAMYGIPFVGDSKKTGCLAYCSDYLVTSSEEDLCSFFDKLMDDHEYYNKIAQSYNKYAVETYSFDTFNKTLNAILKSKGLL